MYSVSKQVADVKCFLNRDAQTHTHTHVHTHTHTMMNARLECCCLATTSLTSWIVSVFHLWSQSYTVDAEALLDEWDDKALQRHFWRTKGTSRLIRDTSGVRSS